MCYSDELNVCYNSVIRILFGYRKWKSVNAVVSGLGRLNTKQSILLHKAKFYIHLDNVICIYVMCFNVFSK